MPIHFRPLPNDDAIDLLYELFAASNKVDIAVAYLTVAGLNLIWSAVEAFLSTPANKLRLLVYPDQWATDGEAVEKLLSERDDCVRFFDSELPGGIFHPKAFCFYTSKGMRVLLGSSNLTYPAWRNNIEFNCLVEESTDTQSFIFELLNHFDNLWEQSSTVAEKALKRFMNEQKGVEDESMPTFNVGDTVRHKTQEKRGLGKVVARKDELNFYVDFGEGSAPVVAARDLVLEADPLQRIRTCIAEREWLAPVDLFDLRTQARFLQTVNAKTGALARVRVDVLPHQMLVTHKVVSSDPVRWLVADDVGLGKTIEAGLIITALQTKGRADRVLIIVPAGLTSQWREEMREKFGMSFVPFHSGFFKLLGSDSKQALHQWKRVIASMDTLKRDDLRESLRGTRWDLVIFDEAHKLSAWEDKGKVEKIDRYRLAESLLQHADVQPLVCLTATPHQGKRSKFFYLLHLIRPDIFKQEAAFEVTKERLREVVIRNRKSTVTDTEGHPLFKHIPPTTRVAVKLTQSELAFLSGLYAYLREGYQLAEREKDTTKRAVGFVMTTFQKLASSSKAAIEHALRKRLDTITGKREVSPPRPRKPGDEADERTEEESIADDERLAHRGKFFPKEEVQLRRLLALLGKSKRETKCSVFMRALEACLKGNRREKILIFTEYRQTQAFLVEQLSAKYGQGRVVQIHGGMDLKNKMANAAAFNRGDAQFLVSTEAGGEGINLQDQCHILFNYDLPWNPMRIHQRIGRLYRYGQREVVQVYQFQQQGKINVTDDKGRTRQVDVVDDKIQQILEDAVKKIVDDLVQINQDEDERENIREYLLGELVDFKWDDVYRQAVITGETKQSEEMLNCAFAQVDLAREKFKELLSGVPGFVYGEYEAIKPDATMEQVEGFVRTFLKTHQGSILESEKDCYNIKVPLAVRRKLHVRDRYDHVTFSHARYQQDSDADFLGFGHELLDSMVQFCKELTFGGWVAGRTVKSKEWQKVEGLQLNFVVTLREDSKLVEEEFVSIFVDSTGKARRDTGEALRLLPSSGTLNVKPRFLTDQFVDAAHVTAQAQAEKTAKELLKDYRRRHPSQSTPTYAADLYTVAAVRFV